MEPLHEAAEQGDLETVKRLLADDPALVHSREDEQGLTALHIAAHYGRLAIARLLLERSSDVNARSTYGTTPLFFAIVAGHKKMTELLLDNNAEVNARLNTGITPLQLVAVKGYLEIAELLLAHKADVNVLTENGHTALNVAVHNGHHEVARLLFPYACRSLEHSDVKVQCASVAALGAYGDLHAVVPLCKAMGTSNKQVFRAVGIALAKLGDRETLPRKLLLSPDLSLRARVAALRALRTEKALYFEKGEFLSYQMPDLKKFCERWSKDADPEVRKAVQEMLPHVENRLVVPLQDEGTPIDPDELLRIPTNPSETDAADHLRSAPPPDIETNGKDTDKRSPKLVAWLRRIFS